MGHMVYRGTYDRGNVVPSIYFHEVVVGRVLEAANVLPAVKVAVPVHVRARFGGAGARRLVDGLRCLDRGRLLDGCGSVRGGDRLVRWGGSRNRDVTLIARRKDRSQRKDETNSMPRAEQRSVE